MEASTNLSAARREIDLHRRVCVIKPEVIDVRPARSAAVVPLIGFALGVFCFIAVLFWIDNMPFGLTLLLMGAAIILVPLAGMGFVYSIYGANVVIDRKKQTAVWQQGMMGMGVGTQELVPFAKIDHVLIEEVSRDEQVGGAQAFAQFEIGIVKASGRHLSIGQLTVPREIRSDGLARAREVAAAIAEMTGRPVEVIAETAPPRHYRRHERSDTTVG